MGDDNTKGVHKNDKENIRFDQNGYYETDSKAETTAGETAKFSITILNVKEKFNLSPEFVITVKSSHNDHYESGTVQEGTTWTAKLPTNGSGGRTSPTPQFSTTHFSWTIQAVDAELMGGHYFEMQWELDY